MKIYNLIFLSTIISACFFNETKHCATGLKNESEKIYTKKIGLLGHTLKWTTAGAAFGSGLTYLLNPKSDYNKIMIVMTTSWAYLVGFVGYYDALTPERVFNRTIHLMKDYSHLLNNLHKDDLDVLGFMKKYYEDSSIFLRESSNQLNRLLYDFNLYVDMMENIRILESLTPEQQTEFFALVPVVESYIEPIIKAIAIIEAHPDFGKEIYNPSLARYYDEATMNEAYAAYLQAHPGLNITNEKIVEQKVVQHWVLSEYYTSKVKLIYGHN